MENEFLMESFGDFVTNQKKLNEENGTPKTDAERAQVHFKITEEAWSELTEDEKKSKINELPTKGNKRKVNEDDHRAGDKVTLKDGTVGTVQSWNDNEKQYIILTSDGKTIEATDDMIVEAADAKAAEEAGEGMINEKDVKDKASLKAYVYAMYKEAFADKFDEKKADDVINGLVKKYKDDWGAMVGAAKSSLA
jgi:preprotein translocase subunit YajC